MRRNHNTTTQTSVTRFALGQTYITPGAEEALQIAGQTAIEFFAPSHVLRLGRAIRRRRSGERAFT